MSVTVRILCGYRPAFAEQSESAPLRPNNAGVAESELRFLVRLHATLGDSQDIFIGEWFSS